MKIGVYGDSFADTTETPSLDFAWYNQLANLIPNSTVTSYGLGSTSVYYSYKKFLETYMEFDIIIFVVTEPGRYTKRIENIVNADRYFHNLHFVEYFLQNNILSSSDAKLLNRLKSWFIMNDDEYNIDMSELMLRDMETVTNTKIIFFPCFNTSMTQERRMKCEIPNHISFTDLLTKQLNLFGIGSLSYATPKENENTIACHLTTEYNHAVATMFCKKILENVWDWSLLEDIKLVHAKDHYYK
jgi:hypothetical protein